MTERALPGGASLGGLIAEGTRLLGQAGIETPALDARLLVEVLTGTSRVDAISDPGRAIDATVAGAVRAAFGRRAAGEPAHRILGWREFYGLRLALSPDTLEPRPDTEALVDLVLPWLRTQGAPRILDLGTGTGAIALALVSELPAAEAVMTDVSEGALETATANAAALGLRPRVTPVLSDWFGNVDGRFDLIVSNPPYIPEREIAGLSREVTGHDPMRALVGGDDGLVAYRAIAAGAAAHLLPGGRVAVEIGAGQGPDVTAIFGQAGFRPGPVARDLGGHERALSFVPVDGKSAD